jgi:hypothetical protein
VNRCRWREPSEEKRSVNQMLVRLAIEQAAAVPRHAHTPMVCVVLDGAGACTTRALLAASSLLGRRPIIHAPNLCTPTYAQLRAVGECVPFLGSLRAFLDSRTCPCTEHAQHPAGAGCLPAAGFPPARSHPAGCHPTGDEQGNEQGSASTAAGCHPAGGRPAVDAQGSASTLLDVVYADYCCSLYASPPISSHLIPSHPLPSHPLPSHLIPSHPIPSHPTP